MSKEVAIQVSQAAIGTRTNLFGIRLVQQRTNDHELFLNVFEYLHAIFTNYSLTFTRFRLKFGLLIHALWIDLFRM